MPWAGPWSATDELWLCIDLRKGDCVHHDSRERDDQRWRVRVRPGAPARRVELVAGGSLRQLPPVAGRTGSWQAGSERDGFVLEPGGLLAAGWYELRGHLEVEGGDTALPSLHWHYAGQPVNQNVEQVLSGAEGSGRIDALVLLREAVDLLGFCPGLARTPFRMRNFHLHRISRVHALRKMLGGAVDARGAGWISRARAWGRAARKHGLKRATDWSYAGYRERTRPRGAGEYGLWVRKYDTVDDAALAAFRRRAQALAGRGSLVTLLTRIGDVSESRLRRCLDSVLAQVWEQWELCIVVEASCTSSESALLAEYAARDGRVSVCRQGPDQDDGQLLSSVRGGLLALLDPQGVLRPQALLRVAEAAAADPELAIVYSDEDEIDDSGLRSRPDFKPDWNPDLLYGMDYVGHLVAFRTALVQDDEGTRAAFVGGRGGEVVMRCSGRVAPRQIHHLPEILYHGPGVIPAGEESHAATAAAGMRARVEQLRHIGSTGTVETVDVASGLHRVRWPLPQPAPKISLIIPTRDRTALLQRCMESILAKTTYPDFEVVVVDNGSRERAALRYLERLAARGRVRVLRYAVPFNYSAINNRAARQCTGPLLGLVNNDIEVITPDWLEEMASLALRPDTGAVGAMLYYPDDTIQHAGMLLGIQGVAGHVYVGKPRGYPGYRLRARLAQNLSAVTGACLLVRRELFDAVGGLDEALPIEFNDVDFCLRLMQRGYRNVWTPFAELYHHESASRSIANAAAKRARDAGVACMRERWGERLYNDPAYNPNLTLQSTDFEIAFPPRRRGEP